MSNYQQSSGNAFGQAQVIGSGDTASLPSGGDAALLNAQQAAAAQVDAFLADVNYEKTSDTRAALAHYFALIQSCPMTAAAASAYGASFLPYWTTGVIDWQLALTTLQSNPYVPAS
jgi:hypothetical protein